MYTGESCMQDAYNKFHFNFCVNGTLFPPLPGSSCDAPGGGAPASYGGRVLAELILQIKARANGGAYWTGSENKSTTKEPKLVQKMSENCVFRVKSLKNGGGGGNF